MATTTTQELPGQYSDDWSDPWWAELERLNRMAEDDHEESKRVYDGIVRICCNVLAELARHGVLGDWKLLDFNVAELLDEIAEVKQRDGFIRQLIESYAQ